VEARGGYEDAIATVLEELMGNARSALGLEADDNRLGQLLMQAIRGDASFEDVLKDCAKHLEQRRSAGMAACVAEVEVSGLDEAGVTAAIEAAVGALELAPSQWLQLQLTGAPPRNGEGVPIVLDLEGIEDTVRAHIDASVTVLVAESVLSLGGEA
jgi:hypothetical protein